MALTLWLWRHLVSPRGFYSKVIQLLEKRTEFLWYNPWRFTRSNLSDLLASFHSALVVCFSESKYLTFLQLKCLQLNRENEKERQGRCWLLFWLQVIIFCQEGVQISCKWRRTEAVETTSTAGSVGQFEWWKQFCQRWSNQLNHTLVRR